MSLAIQILLQLVRFVACSVHLCARSCFVLLCQVFWCVVRSVLWVGLFGSVGCLGVQFGVGYFASLPYVGLGCLQFLRWFGVLCLFCVFVRNYVP